MDASRWITLAAITLALTATCTCGGGSGGSGAPACSADGGTNNPAATSASGSLEGSSVAVSICSGGAFAYLEHTPGTLSTPPEYILNVATALTGDSATFNDVQKPPGAQQAMFIVLAGVSAPSPGTYSSSTGGCGGASFCIYFPTPTTLDCDAGSSTSCPAGCSLQGPGTGPTCMPDTPEVCYVSQATPSCVYGTQPAMGSWTATLTSVEPYRGSTGKISYYTVHGSYTTSMVPGMPSSPDAGTATMILNF